MILEIIILEDYISCLLLFYELLYVRIINIDANFLNYITYFN